MNDNMKKLLDIAKQDNELGVKLQTADKGQVMALAKEQGITLTEADFEKPQGKVSDDELAAVAGGTQCACLLGGGGKASEGEKACGCVIAGIGKFTDGLVRCMCSGFGSGDDIYSGF